MRAYGGLDIGTDGVRLVVVDQALELLFAEGLSYQTNSPRPGWAEQNPAEIYSACINLLRKMVERFPAHQLYLTFSSVMHSLLGVDQAGQELTPLIIWADTRSRGKRDDLEKKYGKELFYQHTACPLHSAYWPARLIWMKEYFQQDFSRYISIKEYLIFKLTGQWMTDYSLASSSGIFNLEQVEYDREILRIAGVDPEQLSPVFSPTESFSFQINGKLITGLIGAADGVLANLGVGAAASNQSVLTVGSSSAVRFISERPVLDAENRVWCYMLEQDFYVIGQATNGAGVLLKWLADIFGYQRVSELLADNLRAIPYQESGLICIPTMIAERGPNYNEDLRGLFYGLSLNHSRQDIVTAVYESIAFFLKMVYDDVKRVNGQEPGSITMTGRLGLSEKFMEFTEYLIGQVSYIPGYQQNTAVGAAMLGVKMGEGLTYQAMLKDLPARQTGNFVLNQSFQEQLANKYRRFKRIYHRISLDSHFYR